MSKFHVVCRKTCFRRILFVTMLTGLTSCLESSEGSEFPNRDKFGTKGWPKKNSASQPIENSTLTMTRSFYEKIPGIFKIPGI